MNTKSKIDNSSRFKKGAAPLAAPFLLKPTSNTTKIHYINSTFAKMQISGTLKL